MEYNSSSFNAEISFRHNVMPIQSLDTFINIRGRFSRGRKDVYFVRAIGECPDFLKTFETLDGRLSDAEKTDRIKYLRIGSLPNTLEKQTSDFYVSLYAEWKEGKQIRTRTWSANQRFGRLLENATAETIEKYKTVRPSISESMIRNFAIKLWYWMDFCLGDVMKVWSEQLNVKIVSDNVVKPQEYLFLYFATLLGFDVLILNNRADINISEKVRQLSAELVLGGFGKVVLPDHGKNVAHTHDSAADHSEKHSTQEKDRTRFSSTQGKDRTAFSGTQGKDRTGSSGTQEKDRTRFSAIQEKDGERSRGDLRQEKSFEELARLASSVVMIAVHDANGDPTATGSGIMIGKKGFILTNFHVVKRGVIFAVRIEDDDEVYLTSEVIKYNPQLDLAVLRIDRLLNPLPVYDGRKKLARGQRVVAIGSPLGLFNSVSDGIISGFRKIKDVDMIQFTAPISNGSSGGAVLNMYGEVIGISTAGVDSGQNINLAVDYSDIRVFARGFF